MSNVKRLGQVLVLQQNLDLTLTLILPYVIRATFLIFLELFDVP